MSSREYELVERYVFGEIDPDEFAELEAALRKSPELRRKLVEKTELDTLLRVGCLASGAADGEFAAGPADSQVDAKRVIAVGGVMPQVLCGIAAVTLLLAFVGFLQWRTADVRVDGIANRHRAEQWQKQREAIAADDRVLAYFSFESSLPSAPNQRLVNEADSGGSDGIVRRGNWTAGRWPNKQALAFDTSLAHVQVDVAGVHEKLTYFTSVFVDSFDSPFTALLNSDQWSETEDGVHWQLRRTESEGSASVELGISYSGKQEVFTSPAVLDLEDLLGRWITVATSVDASKGLVHHFFNGQHVSSEPMSKELRMHIGDAEIGNYDAGSGNVVFDVGDDDTGASRRLRGRMDELIVFAAALPFESILALTECSFAGR